MILIKRKRFIKIYRVTKCNFFFFIPNLSASEHRNSSPPRFNERMNPAPIRTGETIVLLCISQGNPPPTYLWFRESVSGTTMVFNSERIHARAGVLVLQPARVEDAGRYVCHANNTAGSERVVLEVTIVSSLSIHLAPQQVCVSRFFFLSLYLSDIFLGATRFTCFLPLSISSFAFPFDRLTWFSESKHTQVQ